MLFEEFLVWLEKILWKNVVENYREPYCIQLDGEKMHQAYKTKACKMSLQINVLLSHFDFFHANLGAVRDEHSDMFYQDIVTMKNQYQRNWNSSIHIMYYMYVRFC